MKRTARLLSIFLTLFTCLTFAACPPAAKKPPAKAQPKTKPGEVIKKPGEVSRPAAPAAVMTPQRKASDSLVEKGKTALSSKNYDDAAQIFQNAVNVDGSNGTAYYYLALTNHYMGQERTAAGLLDKAESLLRSDKQWMEKIDELRSLVTGEKPPVAPLPPIADEY